MTLIDASNSSAAYRRLSLCLQLCTAFKKTISEIQRLSTEQLEEFASEAHRHPFGLEYQVCIPIAYRASRIANPTIA